jgi:exonuclease VII small subunit
MSDEQTLRELHELRAQLETKQAELDAAVAQRDRLASLVGTCMNEDGTVVPALVNATAQTELEQLRHEVNAVIAFLRENNPNR